MQLYFHYLLDGKNGAGKTTILLHLVHYGLAKCFFVLHLPWGVI